MQDLMGQCGLPKWKFPTVNIVTFGLPKHNLSSKPQPPGNLVTILSVLQLPDDGMACNVVFNHLVDSQRAEKRILVEVSQQKCMVQVSPRLCVVTRPSHESTLRWALRINTH